MITETREEVWRAVAGFCGRYEVSSEGRVRYARDTARRKAGDIVPVQRGKRGAFVTVDFGANTTKRSVSVSRLVAAAFLCAEPYPGAVVSHADNDPLNCAIWNIRWVRRSGNHSHPARSVGREYKVEVEIRTLVTKTVRAGDEQEAWDRVAGEPCLRPLPGFTVELLPPRRTRVRVKEVRHVGA